MRDPMKARNIKILMDHLGHEVAMDTDEIVLVRSVSKAFENSAVIERRIWELTLRSGATVVVDYDVSMEEILEMLDMLP